MLNSLMLAGNEAWQTVKLKTNTGMNAINVGFPSVPTSSPVSSPFSTMKNLGARRKMPKPKSDSDIPATIRSIVNGTHSDHNLQKHLSWDTYVEEVLILKELEPGANDPVRLAPDPNEPEACMFANIKMLQVMKTADGGPKPRPIRRQAAQAQAAAGPVSRAQSAPPTRQLSLLPEDPNESDAVASPVGKDGAGRDASSLPEDDDEEDDDEEEGDEEGDDEGDDGEEEDEEEDEDDEEDERAAGEGEEEEEEEDEPPRFKPLNSPHPRRKDPPLEDIPQLHSLGPAAASANCARSAPRADVPAAPAAVRPQPTRQ